MNLESKLNEYKNNIENLRHSSNNLKPMILSSGLVSKPMVLLRKTNTNQEKTKKPHNPSH